MPPAKKVKNNIKKEKTVAVSKTKSVTPSSYASKKLNKVNRLLAKATLMNP